MAERNDQDHLAYEQGKPRDLEWHMGIKVLYNSMLGLPGPQTLMLFRNMNYSETCSRCLASTQFVSRIPVLDELGILISYIFLLREPCSLLSDHYVAELVYRTLLVVVPGSVLLIICGGIAGVCLHENIKCFAKVFSCLPFLRRSSMQASTCAGNNSASITIYHFNVSLTMFLLWQGCRI
jgi:hypothetical protein